MANSERGQVEMVVKGESYVMQLSPHALACIKKNTGMGFKALTAALQKSEDDPDFELISVVLWASMRDHHPELTVEQAGGLYPSGGLEEIISKIQEVFVAAFPSQKGAVVSEGNPQKAAARK